MWQDYELLIKNQKKKKEESFIAIVISLSLADAYYYGTDFENYNWNLWKQVSPSDNTGVHKRELLGLIFINANWKF